MKPITQHDLLEALRQYGKARAKRPTGAGWATLEEMAHQEGVTRAAMRYRLLTAQRNGLALETATGSVVDDEGRAKRATYYRLKGKP